MARIEPLSPPYPSDLQAQFDRIMPPGVPPLALFRTVAKSDRAWRKLSGGSLLDPGPLPLREREIVIDRTCALNDCAYEWGVHVAFFAAAAGLGPDEIAATVHGDAGSTCWEPADQALIAAVDALNHRARLSAAEFERLRGYFDEAQIIEIIQLCGFYRTIACLVGSLDIASEPGMPGFPDRSDAQADV